MKKMIALIVALTFALSMTAVAFAQAPPAGMPLSADEKAQVGDAKKKATKKQVAPKEGAGLPATLGPEEKQDIQEAKKKATAKPKPTVKDSGASTLGPEEKLQLDEAKKKSSAQKRKEKKEMQKKQQEAAPAAPAAPAPEKK